MGSQYKNNLRINNKLENLQQVRKFIQDSIDECRIVPSKWKNKICLAVDEAVSNIIEHGYEGQSSGQIDIDILAFERQIEIVITDSGKKFNPETLPDVDIEEHVKAARKGGLGVFLMRKIMDEVRYIYKEGLRNELHLVKFFDEENA